MKNKDYRELQVSSSVLIFIFIGVIIVGIVIFLLGVSVGKKQAAAAGIPATPQSQFEDVVAEKPKPAAEEGDPISQELEGHQAAQQETRRQPEEVTQPEVKTPPPAEKPAPKKSSPPAAKSTVSPGGNFFLQIGAFRNRESADAVVEKYRSMGFPGQVIIPAAGDSRQLYRVLLGGYNTRDDAERAKARLVETGRPAKHPDRPVPVAAMWLRQQVAEPLPVEFVDAGMASGAEDREEIVPVESADARHLQFQQRILPGIHVHGGDMRRLLEQVVEGVAPARRDHENMIVIAESEDGEVGPWILPAAAVDETAVVDEPEDPLPDGVAQSRPFSHRIFRLPPPTPERQAASAYGADLATS